MPILSDQDIHSLVVSFKHGQSEHSFEHFNHLLVNFSRNPQGNLENMKVIGSAIQEIAETLGLQLPKQISYFGGAIAKAFSISKGINDTQGFLVQLGFNNIAIDDAIAHIILANNKVFRLAKGEHPNLILALCKATNEATAQASLFKPVPKSFCPKIENPIILHVLLEMQATETYANIPHVARLIEEIDHNGLTSLAKTILSLYKKTSKNYPYLLNIFAEKYKLYPQLIEKIMDEKDKESIRQICLMQFFKIADRYCKKDSTLDWIVKILINPQAFPKKHDKKHLRDTLYSAVKNNFALAKDYYIELKKLNIHFDFFSAADDKEVLWPLEQIKLISNLPGEGIVELQNKKKTFNHPALLKKAFDKDNKQPLLMPEFLNKIQGKTAAITKDIIRLFAKSWSDYFHLDKESPAIQKAMVFFNQCNTNTQLALLKSLEDEVCVNFILKISQLDRAASLLFSLEKEKEDICLKFIIKMLKDGEETSNVLFFISKIIEKLNKTNTQKSSAFLEKIVKNIGDLESSKIVDFISNIKNDIQYQIYYLIAFVNSRRDIVDSFFQKTQGENLCKILAYLIDNINDSDDFRHNMLIESILANESYDIDAFMGCDKKYYDYIWRNLSFDKKNALLLSASKKDEKFIENFISDFFHQDSLVDNKTIILILYILFKNNNNFEKIIYSFFENYKIDSTFIQIALNVSAINFIEDLNKQCQQKEDTKQISEFKDFISRCLLYLMPKIDKRYYSAVLETIVNLDNSDLVDEFLNAINKQEQEKVNLSFSNNWIKKLTKSLKNLKEKKSDVKNIGEAQYRALQECLQKKSQSGNSTYFKPPAPLSETANHLQQIGDFINKASQNS